MMFRARCRRSRRIERRALRGVDTLNEIVALTIHDLDRRDGVYKVQAADKQLNVTPTTQRLIDELYDLYNRRASKSHGKFTSAEGFPTQAQVRDYVADTKKDFLSPTSRMMETLRNQAQARSASTGGHVLFAHFRRETRDYLLVAIITDKLSAALTSQRDVQDVRHLDLDGFRFAGRINLTAWSNGEERYISFLKGKGDVSAYFQHFLGCDSVVQDRVDTRVSWRGSLWATLRTLNKRTTAFGIDLGGIGWPALAHS